jgi:zinc protease
MPRFFRSFVLTSALALVSAAAMGGPTRKPEALATAPLPIPDIAFTKVVLSNGLTLIVHEDHKAPVVAVNLWYHVGSKDEPPGRTGFAHLFEHLMFGGTGGNQRGWFERLEAVGATDSNGTTNNDRTNFFETVPTPALDMTLAMEAGRMGHLLDSFSLALLNTQRGVVQNEKRQGDNQPYAVANDIITRSIWPAGHPYSHTVIGEMADLDAAKVEDVKDWFSKYYGPTNAVLVLAGDITVSEARAKAERFFGAIPPGPPVAHQKEWIAKRSGAQRAEVEDRVPQARLYVEWNGPPAGSADADLLSLLQDVLAVGKDSRLYRRLVYEDQIATNVAVNANGREIAGIVDVELTAKPGIALSRLEAAFHEELDKLLREGPTLAELERFKTRRVANFVRRAEQVGGFGGKSDILAQAQVFYGDPGSWKASLERVRAATPAAVTAAGRRWMNDGSFTLAVTPFPSYAATAGTAAASAIPEPGAPLDPHFSAVRRATLSNGLKVVIAERHQTPIVTLGLIVDAGNASDPAGLAGLSSIEAAALLDGTRDLDALAFDDRKIALGVTLSANSGQDTSTVFMSALSARLDPSLDLLADVVLRPAFRPADIDREKSLASAGIRQAKEDPVSAALRVAPELAYGDHPYGRLTTEASLASISPEAVARHHQNWFRPQGATLVVVGDTTAAMILPRLEARFGRWQGAGPAPTKTIAAVAPRQGSTVYLIDKPGALQSVISASIISPPKNNPDDIAIQAMVTTMGGAFTSRLNMNLREDKHWAYGAFAFVQDARGPSLFTVLAPVQTDKTKESFVEVRRELTEVVSTRPLAARELELAQHNLTLSLPGEWETGLAVASSLADIATYPLPDDYYDSFAAKVRALTQADVQRAAVEVVRPDQLIWVIVGDKNKVKASLESLGLSIRMIDADGRPAG